MSTLPILYSDGYLIINASDNACNLTVNVQHNGYNYGTSDPLVVSDYYLYSDIAANISMLTSDITVRYSPYGITAATIPASNITPLHIKYTGHALVLASFDLQTGVFSSSDPVPVP